MTSGPKRLVLSLHVPKTGGTTLSHILQREICHRVENLMGKGGFADTTAHMAASSLDAAPDDPEAPIHLVFRGWRDWQDVHTRREELVPRRAVIFEGGVWGADHLIGDQRRVDYVTTIRNPINTFRSNFNYGKRRYGVHRDLGAYVDEYGANIFTNLLGHGELALAKRRLRDEFSAFTVLEDFERSLEVLAERLGLEDVTFGIRNRSGSETVEIPPEVERRFWERNRDDRELYDFARELLEQRDAGQRYLERAHPAQNTEGEGEFPVGFQSRDESLLVALDAGDDETAVRLLSSIEKPDFSASMNLGRLLVRQGRASEAAAHFEHAFSSQPNVALLELVACYMAFDPAAALARLEAECDGMVDIPCSTTFDDLVSRELASGLEVLTLSALEAGRPEDAIRHAQAGIALIDTRLALGERSRLFTEQRRRLILNLIRAAAESRRLDEARAALVLYRQEDPDLSSVSLRENSHIRSLAPGLYAKQIVRRALGLRAPHAGRGAV